MTDYHTYNHTHCLLRHPTGNGSALGGGWDGSHEIVLRTRGRVWIGADYSMTDHPDVALVGDGTPSAHDEMGGCVVSVPDSWVSAWLTPDEAETADRCLDADEQLLSYAR